MPRVGTPSWDLLLIWLLCANLYTFIVFAWDKRCAVKGFRRVSEFHLLSMGALGGWIGGLAAMLLFRHKTAKTSFRVKFFLAVLVSAGLLWIYLRSGKGLFRT